MLVVGEKVQYQIVKKEQITIPDDQYKSGGAMSDRVASDVEEVNKRAKNMLDD